MLEDGDAQKEEEEDMGRITERKKKRSEETKEKDIQMKRLRRKETKDIINKAIELEDQFRSCEGKTKLRAMQRKIVSLLEILIKRVTTVHLTGVIPAKQSVSPRHGTTLEGVSYWALFKDSPCVGTLYVCLDDWLVKESNAAMKLLCPFRPIRGYVGQQLLVFVHPDDHPQLFQIFEQTHQCRPGSTVSLRLLRACMDDRSGILLFDYSRVLTLEVASVAADGQNGGKTHVLFTCFLDEQLVTPLKFDAAEKQRLDFAATCVSGTMVAESIVKSQTNKSMNRRDDESARAPEGSFFNGLSGFMARQIGLDDLTHWILSCVGGGLRDTMKFHVLFGIDSNGIPWLQKSMALTAYGMVSQFRTFINSVLSGTPVFESGAGRYAIGGYLLSRPVGEGKFKCGTFLLGGGGVADASKHKEQLGQVWGYSISEWIFHPTTQAMQGHDRILRQDAKGMLFQRLDAKYKRVSGVDAELLASFRKFDQGKIGLGIKDN